MLVCLFASSFATTSNRESGLGRYDVAVRDTSQKRAAIIEVQRARSEQELPAMAEKALRQIEEKEYDTELKVERCYTTILHAGMAFCGKTCKVLLQAVNLP